MNLLFICTGNTCRSPLAEVIAEAEAEARGLSGVECASAGVFASHGHPAAVPAIAVAAEHDLSLGEHESQPLSPEMAEWADVVIGMSLAHVDAAARVAPDTPVHLVSDFLPANHTLRGRGIPDPIGGDHEIYSRTFDVLELALQGLLDALREQLAASEGEPT